MTQLELSVHLPDHTKVNIVANTEDNIAKLLHDLLRKHEGLICRRAGFSTLRYSEWRLTSIPKSYADRCKQSILSERSIV